MGIRFWTQRRQIYARFLGEVVLAIVFTIWLGEITNGKYGVGFAVMLISLQGFLLYRRLKKFDAKRAAMTEEERQLADAPEVFSKSKIYLSTVVASTLGIAAIWFSYPKWSVTRTVLSSIVIVVAIGYSHYSRMRKLETH